MDTEEDGSVQEIKVGGSILSLFFFFNQKRTSLSRTLSDYGSEKCSPCIRCGEPIELRNTVRFLSWNRPNRYTLLCFIRVFTKNGSNTRQSFCWDGWTPSGWSCSAGIWNCVYECYSFCKMLWAPSMCPHSEHHWVLEMDLLGKHLNIRWNRGHIITLSCNA